MDFTLKLYKVLIESMIENDYHFLTVEGYFKNSVSLSGNLKDSKSQSRPAVIMRHDVDRKPGNSLRMAKLEHELGVKATYYFRTIPHTLKPEIIREIAKLGHEIGYHYENLSDAQILMKKEKCKKKNVEKYKEKLFDLAINDFERNLTKLREIVSIKNIAMHGRPTSKWDSRLLWDKYDYKEYGIISEPYFDFDFNKVQYITDAGRSWDNANINLRDKVNSPFVNNFKHTDDINTALNENKLSNQIMINIHPEHWAETQLEWFKIWVIRKIKNTVKRVVIRRRN